MASIILKDKSFYKTVAKIAIPIALLYIFTQKFYQEAMSGAVKG